jgi:hypothetical protein
VTGSRGGHYKIDYVWNLGIEDKKTKKEEK